MKPQTILIAFVVLMILTFIVVSSIPYVPHWQLHH
jgi:hypothetical protein